MKKIRILSSILLATVLMIISPSFKSTAAETATTSPTLIQMSDGGYFDPTFYMQSYPDVVAALGTDTKALYQHYIHYGQFYGNMPFSPSDAALIQSITYVPGSIVVPISVKTHPEGRNILMYSDANVDIFYRGSGSMSWLTNKADTLGFGITVVNKSDKEMTIVATDSSVNNKMSNMVLYGTIFAGASSDESISSTDITYSKEVFNSINNATFSLYYYLNKDFSNRQNFKINMIFTH